MAQLTDGDVPRQQSNLVTRTLIRHLRATDGADNIDAPHRLLLTCSSGMGWQACQQGLAEAVTMVDTVIDSASVLR